MPTPNGPKNQPRFDLNDDGNFPADLTTIAEYAALVGNAKVGTTTQRNAASGKDVWEGLLWNDTTDGNQYRRVAGDWVLWTMGAPSYKTNVLYGSVGNPSTGSGGYAICYYRVIAGWVDAKWNVYFNGSPGPGAGNWGLKLPIAARLTAAGQLEFAGSYRRLGSSADSFGIFGYFDSNDLANMANIWSAAGVRLVSSLPNIAVDGDRMMLSGGYPIATAINR